LSFLNIFKAQAHDALPASANPGIGRSVGTKTVAIRLGSRKYICDHARSRIVSGAFFYGRAYWGALAPAGFANVSGLPTRYSPTAKNSFDCRAFLGGRKR